MQQVRVVLLALRQLSTGQTPPQVAHNLDLSPKAVRAIGARFEKEGLAGALYEKQRQDRLRSWPRINNGGSWR